MAPGKPKIPTGRSPGRPRKVGRGFDKVVGSKAAKSINITTSTALRSGRVVTPRVSVKEIGNIDKGGPALNETPIKRGRGRPKKNVDVEIAVDGTVADGAMNGETEAVKKVEDEKAEEDADIAVPTPEVKRGRGRPRKIVSEVSTEDVLEAALATASASTKSNEAEDDSADEVEAETGPTAAGTKRGRGRPKKESSLIDNLAPSSPAAATVSLVKRGKGRPPKKKRLSYFGRPVPAVPSEESMNTGEQEGDGADDSIVVNAGSESSKVSNDGEVEDTPAAAALLEANTDVPKLLPSLMPHSAGLSPSPSHGGNAVAQELEPNAAQLEAGRPRYHGIFKGKAGEEEKLELAPEEAAGSGDLTSYGNKGANADTDRADASARGTCSCDGRFTGRATLTLNSD